MTSIGIGYPREPAVGKYWWLLLLSGILWIIIGLFVLEADFDSAVLIGYLVAFWLLYAGVAEFMQMGISIGWGWLHVLLGVLFILGGIAALLSPFQTFTVLAELIGFFLVLKGSFDFGVALSVRHELDLWWLVLIGGILQIVIGIWAAGYPGRSAALLILWIGIGAIVRGVVEISTSFHVRKLHEVVAA